MQFVWQGGNFIQISLKFVPKGSDRQPVDFGKDIAPIRQRVMPMVMMTQSTDAYLSPGLNELTEGLYTPRVGGKIPKSAVFTLCR